MDNKAYFDTRFTYDAKRDVIWKQLCAYLQRYIPADSKVLDLGPGYCSFINNIKAQEKHALDICPEVADYTAKGVIFHVGSVCRMQGVKDGYFDIVFASNLFEHFSMEELKECLGEVKRVMSSSAKLIIIQPNFRYCYKSYFDDYTHRQVFTDVSISDFLSEQGLKATTIIPKFLPFSFKSRLPKSGWLIWSYLRSPFKPFAGQMLVISQKKC